jgi:hypothetical protein
MQLCSKSSWHSCFYKQTQGAPSLVRNQPRTAAQPNSSTGCTPQLCAASATLFSCTSFHQSCHHACSINRTESGMSQQVCMHTQLQSTPSPMHWRDSTSQLEVQMHGPILQSWSILTTAILEHPDHCYKQMLTVSYCNGSICKRSPQLSPLSPVRVVTITTAGWWGAKGEAAHAAPEARRSASAMAAMPLLTGSCTPATCSRTHHTTAGGSVSRSTLVATSMHCTAACNNCIMAGLA